MIVRRIGRVWVFLLVSVFAGSACAESIGEFWSGICRDFKRRNCWPQPFVYSDRQAVREPLAVMIGNGWQRQNLVGDVHFEGGGTALNEAGRRRVLDILNEAPEQHRIVFVFRGATTQETTVRIATVQQFVAQSAYGGQVAPVVESNRPDDGWPADRIDAVNRKFQAAIPDPKLPASSGGTAGGSGGSGGSGSAH
ncbi:MAG: hypothetical protein ABR915_04125 [Thermoguttaceae bacterium]|jgi:hypothetical protein